MSHIIRVGTKMTEPHLIEAALKRLNWNYSIQSNTFILENGKVTMELETSGTYVVRGDPYYSTGALRSYYNKSQKLMADLQTQYNIEMAKERLESMGYICVDNPEAQVNSQGKIQMIYEGY